MEFIPCGGCGGDSHVQRRALPPLMARKLFPIQSLRFTIFCEMDLLRNIGSVRERIGTACARVGRDPSSVTLVAVSKGQPPEVISEAARLGLALFGENKIQEAKAKIPMCPGRLHWHFIGHLQTNKCREAVELFEMVQSVDSLHVAEELNKRAEQAAKTLRILIEVNIVGEASKFGYCPEKLRTELSQLDALPRLEIHGLMTVP